MKRVIRFISLFLVVFGLILANNSFFVFADNDIETYVTEDISVAAWQYWFNQGCDNYISYNTDGSTTTYSGSLNVPVHNISFGSRTGSITWGNYSNTAYEGFLSAQSTSSTITSNSSGVPTGFRNSAQYIGLADMTITLPYAQVASHTIGIGGVESTEVNSLKSIITNNYITGYTNISSYVSDRRIQINSNEPYYISFFANANIAVSDITVYKQDPSVNVTVERLSIMPMNAGMNKLAFIFTTDKSTAIAINWGGLNSSSKIRPVFNGPEKIMPDYCAQFLGIETTTEKRLLDIDNDLNTFSNRQHTDITAFSDRNHSDLTTANNHLSVIRNDLANGGSGTQETKTNMDNSRRELTTATNTYSTFESNNITTAKNNLQAIGTNNNLYNNNGFLNAVNFVSTTFTNLINLDTTNALNLMITFSLILGVALTIIGKLRN